MYSIIYPWKSFKIHLPDFEQWLRSISTAYVGNSADSNLTLWFSTKPSQQTLATIQAHWDSLTAKNEHSKINAHQQGRRAIQAAIQTLPFKNWDAMTPQERKLIMNLTLSTQEMTSLISIYPTV